VSDYCRERQARTQARAESCTRTLISCFENHAFCWRQFSHTNEQHDMTPSTSIYKHQQHKQQQPCHTPTQYGSRYLLCRNLTSLGIASQQCFETQKVKKCCKNVLVTVQNDNSAAHCYKVVMAQESRRRETTISC